MKNDFLKFMANDSHAPSKELDDQVLKSIGSKLSVSHSKVFLKLISVQLFIGLITLTFCPQFNISLTSESRIFHYLHHNFGELICTGVCATIFMGSGALFANFIMSLKELSLINNNKFIYSLSISGIFISIFLILNTEIYYLSAIIWLLCASLTFTLVNTSYLGLRKLFYIH